MEQDVGGWRPITDVRPLRNQAVMVHYANGMLGIARGDYDWDGEWRWYDCATIREDSLSLGGSLTITDWRDLPDPPSIL